MRPVTVLNGVLFASAAAIALGLACTLLVFAWLAPDHPRLGGEMRPLLATTGLFLLVTVACGAAFHAHLTARPWRWSAQVVSVLAILAAVWHFIPA